MRALSILLAVSLSGCGYTWRKAEDVGRVSVVKIESPLAANFCSSLLGAPRRACAMRVRNSETGTFHCVVVILPNDADAAAHEGGHCMGYDH